METGPSTFFWVNDKIAFIKFMQIKLTELAHLKTFSSFWNKEKT